MKEVNNIDQLFKSALESYSEAPSSNVWKGINRKLSWNEFASFNFTNFSQNIYQITIAGIAATGIIAFTTFSILNTSAPSAPDNNISENLVPETKLPDNIIEDNVYHAQPKEFSVLKDATPLVGPKKNQEQTISVINTVSASQPEEIINTRTLEVIPLMNVKSASLYALGSAISGVEIDFSKHRDSVQNRINRGNEDLLLPWRFGFSAGYSFEHMQLPKPAQSFEYNYNTFDLNARIEKGKFNLQIGLQHARHFDQNSSLVTYKTYDSVGYYYDVHYYIPDPNEPQNVILVTSTVTRFDSVPKTFTSYSNSSYDYLTIPIIAGFRVWENQHFYCEVAAGPSVQILLNSIEPGNPVFQTFKSTSNNYSQAFERNKLLFQMNTSIRLGYQVNQNLRIEAEPVFRYAFTDLYKEISIPRPYSYGLRAGMVFLF